MSMPALLSQFGLDTHRFVTAEGRVIFDGVGATTSGYSHPDYGSVSAMSPHGFHGDGPEPTDDSTTATWWDDQAQLQRHIDALASTFPGFRPLEFDGEQTPMWFGDIDTGRGKFTVAVALRRDRRLPFVRVVKGPKLGIATGRSWIPSPHLYLNGNLCIAAQSDWDPDVHTVATAVAWTAHWLAAFTEWRITRRWPVEGFQQDVA